MGEWVGGWKDARYSSKWYMEIKVLHTPILSCPSGEQSKKTTVFISWYFSLSLNYQLLKGNNYVTPLGLGTMPDSLALWVYSCWLHALSFTPTSHHLTAFKPADHDSPLVRQVKHLLFTQDLPLILSSFTDKSYRILTDLISQAETWLSKPGIWIHHTASIQGGRNPFRNCQCIQSEGHKLLGQVEHQAYRRLKQPHVIGANCGLLS